MALIETGWPEPPALLQCETKPTAPCCTGQHVPVKPIKMPRVGSVACHAENSTGL